MWISEGENIPGTTANAKALRYIPQTYGGAPSLMEEADVSQKQRATFEIQWKGQEFRTKLKSRGYRAATVAG